ncbi:transposable element Tc1 transposase [Trichonephila clavipes]|nr:transposable element Tc1 transposase [Trichonephila clavipes]
MNPTSNYVLTIIEDVSGDAQGSPDPLVVIRVTITAQRYVDDILRTVLLPFLLKHRGLIFQQDNVRFHTARDVMNCLTACQTLPWTSGSPYFSPIKHVWDMMRRWPRLSWNADDLARQLKQIWQEIAHGSIRSWLEIYANLQSPKTPKSINDKVPYRSVTKFRIYNITEFISTSAPIKYCRILSSDIILTAIAEKQKHLQAIWKPKLEGNSRCKKGPPHPTPRELRGRPLEMLENRS